jgi:hypothetical protein
MAETSFRTQEKINVVLGREVSEDKRETSEAFNKLQTEVLQAREAVNESLTQLWELDDIDEFFRDIESRDRL